MTAEAAARVAWSFSRVLLSSAPTSPPTGCVAQYSIVGLAPSSRRTIASAKTPSPKAMPARARLRSDFRNKDLKNADDKGTSRYRALVPALNGMHRRKLDGMKSELRNGAQPSAEMR